MGNNLNGLAQIIAAPLFFQHGGIDPARRDGISVARVNAGKPLVVAEVQIGLGAVIGDKHFAMLER